MMDVEINLRSDNGIAIRPIPIRIIISYIMAALVGFWLLTQTFLAQAALIWQILFVIVYILLTLYLFRMTDTGQPQFSLLSPMMYYLTKSNRTIITRNSAKANEFRWMTNLKSINPDTGLLEFMDGDFGYAYRVVGSGSRLLFESDKKEIIDHTDRFYQKIRPGHQLIFITTKEPQKVGVQARVMKYRYDHLKTEDPQLREMMEQNFDALKHRVGRDSRSIHQYMILKAPNMEELKALRSIFQAEAEGSAWVFKQASALFGDDLYELFHTVYGPLER